DRAGAWSSTVWRARTRSGAPSRRRRRPPRARSAPLRPLRPARDGLGQAVGHLVLVGDVVEEQAGREVLAQGVGAGGGELVEQPRDLLVHVAVGVGEALLDRELAVQRVDQ